MHTSSADAHRPERAVISEMIAGLAELQQFLRHRPWLPKVRITTPAGLAEEIEASIYLYRDGDVPGPVQLAGLAARLGAPVILGEAWTDGTQYYRASVQVAPRVSVRLSARRGW